MSQIERPVELLHRPFSWLLVAATCLLLLAPFSTKALHVDDPLFVWTARQIHESPADFYGFDVNWYGKLEPMFEVNHNPPGFPYALALWAVVFGWGEAALHWFVFLAALAAALGTYALARESGAGDGAATTLSLIAAPGFLVTATTVMCDMPLLALYVWAVALWVRALKRGSPAAAIGSLACVTAAGLTKYFGVSLVPLLALYALLQPQRERRLWSLALLLPLAAFGGYEWMTRGLYDVGLLGQAAGAATAPHLAGGSTLLARALSALVFAGGCFTPILFLAPLLFRVREWLPILALSALCAVGLGLGGAVGHHVFRDAEGVRWALAAQTGAMLGAALLLLLLVAQDVWRSRDALGVLLAAWVGGTLVFAFPVSQFVAARVVLPLLPAAALLVGRRLARRGVGRGRWLALAPALILALVVAGADAASANSARATAREIAAQLDGQPGRVWFQGHWGFQYYMQRQGARAVEFRHDRSAAGDFVVIPTHAANVRAIDGGRVERGMQLSKRPSPWLATMQAGAGAGFYSELWGPAPFAFGPVPEDVYYIYRLNSPGAEGPRSQ
ncbi:MAG: glycosyltransferase family 39 protein [bacterium]|nr:glycosyltransferase family 39 protein [bacterium]